MIIKFVVGDHSGDGHDKTHTIVAEATIATEDGYQLLRFATDTIHKAYKAGVKKIGFDLCRDVADAYEDNIIGWDELQKLRQSGYKGEFAEELSPDEDEDNPGAILEPDEFFDMYCFFVKIGNPNISITPCESCEPTINIGGYGLFE